MKKVNFFLTAVLIICLFSCYKNPEERNRLVFKNKHEDVEDSLFKMKLLLMKLPKRLDDFNINYNVKDGNIYVNDSLVDSSDKRSIESLTFTEKKRFIILTNYLDKNFMSSGYFDKNYKVWRFIYREFPDIDYNDSRNVLILDSSDIYMINKFNKILDYKGMVYLTAPIDAKIR